MSSLKPSVTSKKLFQFFPVIIFSIFLSFSFIEFSAQIFSILNLQTNQNSMGWLYGAVWTFSWQRAIIIALLLFAGYVIYKVHIKNILRQKEDIEKMYRNRTRELKEKNRDLIIAKKEMTDILENVKEGLFLINKEFFIESQYSAALEGILSKSNLGKTSFIDYFSNKLTEEEVNSIKDYLEILFDETIDESLINELNPLSKTKLEFSYTENDTITKYLTFEFGRIIQDGNIIKIIASVDDITEKLILEQNLELSRREVEQRTNRLQTILSIEPALLKEFILSTKDELHILNTIIKDKSVVDEGKLNELFRSIHVIKGNAGLLGFSFFADHAHEIENFISAVHKDKSYTKATMYNIKVLIVGLNDLYHELKTLIDRLTKFLEQFKMDKEDDSNLLVHSMGKYVNHIAKELEVDVKLKTDKFESSVIPSKYRLVVKDMIIQLVRNSIHHGIEKTAERLKNKKSKQATIELSCTAKEDYLCITVSDDGRGLQLKLLRKKAITSGHWNEAEVNSWDDQQVYQVIFETGISTAKDVSLTAGRGVGMDVIKYKMELINGSIKIDSKEGCYTKFVLEIPFTNDLDKNEIALATLT